jgi:hypothetical protein
VRHIDTGAPAFLSLKPSQSVLSPNGQLVKVEIESVLVDLIDHWPFSRIVGVTSNETGAGDRPRYQGPDVRKAGDVSVWMRAARNADGSERVYRIEVEGFDRSGNTARKIVEVTVR